MATTQNLSAVTAALAQAYPDRIRRQINRASVLLSILPITVGSGKNVAWDVEASGAIGENFSDGADVANYGSDDLAAAVLSWGLYRGNFTVTNLAAASAGSSQSPNDAKDLMSRNMVNSMSRVASVINAACYSGTGTGTTMAGFAIAIDSAGTYATIDRSTSTWWQSYEIDAGAALVSFDAIRTDLAAIYTNSGFRPDVGLCAPATLNKLKGLFDPNRTYGKDVSTARGVTTLANNSDVVMIDGCAFIEDKDATAASIFYLNSNEIEVQVLPQAMNFANPLGAADDGFNKLMLAFHAYELGRTGSARKASVEAQLQLKVNRCNAFGKRTNIG